MRKMLQSAAGDHSIEKEKHEWPSKPSPQISHAKESTRVMRRFINSAIYVEKTFSCASSNENVSISSKVSNEDIVENKIKRCTCSVNQKTCPCHFDNCLATILKDEKRNMVPLKITENKVKISENAKFSNNINDERDQLLKKWTVKKEKEKRKREDEARKAQEAKIKEKQIQREQERNNFKIWLMNKKKIEMETKKRKKKELEEQQIKDLEKEKRDLENQLNFQLWRKRKEEALLEKKIQKQMELINELERKEKQLKENEKAFSEWLQNSKTKQKPVPLNRGLETLYSSSSITYVNPIPWNPVP